MSLTRSIMNISLHINVYTVEPCFYEPQNNETPPYLVFTNNFFLNLDFRNRQNSEQPRFNTPLVSDRNRNFGLN